MMTLIPSRLSIRPRLRKPAVFALAGMVFIAAWLVRGGHLWWISILSVTGLGHLFGLSSFGVSEAGADNGVGDPSVRPPARSPAQG